MPRDEQLKPTTFSIAFNLLLAALYFSLTFLIRFDAFFCSGGGDDDGRFSCCTSIEIYDVPKNSWQCAFRSLHDSAKPVKHRHAVCHKQQAIKIENEIASVSASLHTVLHVCGFVRMRCLYDFRCSAMRWIHKYAWHYRLKHTQRTYEPDLTHASSEDALCRQNAIKVIHF